MRIAVAGGTGLVGRLVVDAVAAAGLHPVVLARSTGVDLSTGTGLTTALAGADAVIDVSNVTTTRRAVAEGFFDAATTHLVDAAHEVGVGHLVVLSIVGVDRCPFGYYQGKLRQEAIALEAPVPASVLRATQFHEFAGQLLDRSAVPAVPSMLSQPIAAAEVATALLDLARGPAVGLAPELAGPERHQMVDLARRVQRARGRRLPVLGVPLPGAAGRAMRAGALLPTGQGPRGSQTFDAWLAATFDEADEAG